MECIRITEDTLNWFRTIIPAELEERFLEDPNTCAFGAICDKTACGVLIFEISEFPDIPENEEDEEEFEGDDEIDEEELEIEEYGRVIYDILYLAVSDEYRRRGAATALIQTLIDCARDTLSPIITYFSVPDEDDPLYLFFKYHPDFTIEERDEYVCRISHDMLVGNKQLAVFRKRAPKCSEFFSMSPVAQRGFMQQIGEDAEYVFGGREYIEPLCLCVRNGKKVDAAVFIERYGDNDLYLSYAYGAPEHEAALIGLLAEAAGRVAQYDLSSDLYLAAVTPSSVSITDRLFPQKEITQHFYMAAWDLGY